jgi:AcrR family transcriptional regulator
VSALARLGDDGLLADPIADAVLTTIRDRGYAAADTEEFLRRADMTRAEFETRFAGKQDVTRRIIDAHLDLFVRRVGRAYAAVEGWPDNLRAAGFEAGRYLLENPEATWFMTVGIFEADEMTRARRDRVLLAAAGLIDAGGALTLEPGDVPRAASVMTVGSFVEALRRSQIAGRGLDLAQSLPWLMYAAVRPYLGEDAAARELTIALPADLVGEGIGGQPVPA